MKSRKINKKNLIILTISAVGVFMILCGTFYYFFRNEYSFYIDGEKMKQMDVSLEYGEDYSLLPEDLKLVVKNSKDEDVSDQMKYETVPFDDLKTYNITYEIKDGWKTEKFTLNITVEDKTAPVFSGSSEIDWELNKTFSSTPSDQNITAQDVHDGDVSEFIKVTGEVDTSQKGSYNITYSVIDQAGNKSEHVLKVNIKDEADLVASQEDMYGDPREITPKIIDPNNISVLVNKHHAIPDGWEPSDLVSITSNNGMEMYLRSEAASAWEKLNSAAQGQGIDIFVVSSFRTASYQASLFNNYYAIDGANAFLYSALSRRSEHELGLAIDVSNDGQLHEDLLNTNVGKFMNNEGYKYGFILRYPEDKINRTGYGFEAWHYRYVGVDLATELKSRNIVLEEYYNEK